MGKLHVLPDVLLEEETFSLALMRVLSQRNLSCNERICDFSVSIDLGPVAEKGLPDVLLEEETFSLALMRVLSQRNLSCNERICDFSVSIDLGPVAEKGTIDNVSLEYRKYDITSSRI